MQLQDKAKSFPRRPGVYLFKGPRGSVLYVGKAKRLCDRVQGYFTKGRDERAQVRFLLRRTRDIDFIVTDTEKEALLLENTLIKEYRPRYNLSLRDDKSYVSIRIGADHPFPGISLTRKIKKDGALYFGPYDMASAAREAVENITRYFRVRSCADTEFANRVRPCLKYDIGRCTAPCVGRVSQNDYASQVKEAEMLLSGRSKELMKRLAVCMQTASEATMFEKAARFRDALSMLKGIVEKQKAVRHHGGDHDAVGAACLGTAAATCVLRVRGGALLGKRVHIVTGSPADEEALIEEFLLAHYRENSEIPPRVFLSHRPEGLSGMTAILSDRRGAKVALTVPSRGEMARLAQLAATNAREVLLAHKAAPGSLDVLERLGHKLRLGASPGVIECVDISNLSGREAYGSIVTFVGGLPDKSRYRLYKIRTLTTPDDYGMMKEVLSRRYAIESLPLNHAARRAAPPLPDLLLVDGGKGQLATARHVLDDIGIKIPIAAIAKAKKRGDTDHIFIPGRKNPLGFKRGSKELLLLARIRDEAHRFGIKAHRRRRMFQAFGIAKGRSTLR